jgi:hypothetical protein
MEKSIDAAPRSPARFIARKNQAIDAMTPLL